MIKLPKISPILRIALGLIALTTTSIFVASLLGLVPDMRAEHRESRRHLCESIATTFTSNANSSGIKRTRELLQIAIDLNPDLLSIGIRRADGTELLEIPEHFDHWTLADQSPSTDSEIYVPVLNGKELWGTVETRFTPLSKPGLMGKLASFPELALAAFVGLFGLAAFYIYLRFVLQQLNPSKVIPPRVRKAFDSLAEGVLVLDTKERIVLANKAFQEATDLPMELLMGKQASRLPFATKGSPDGKDVVAPWVKTLQGSETVQRQVMEFNHGSKKPIFSVSCAPILDGKDKSRGALASFENVTHIESQRAELETLVDSLTAATEEITNQNRELERLANVDSLTNCFNRRHFLTKFETFWEVAKPSGKFLSVVMVDIDHFKTVNDNHGHATGDEVLRDVAFVLLNKSRESDVVCRFGGEEFAILLPDTDIEHAKYVADQMRIAIERLVFDDLSVTASLGVSSLCYGAVSPQDLLEQADKSLYFAKRNGRNQIINWNDVPKDIEIDESLVSRENLEGAREIPFLAVTALISSLAFRDQTTASHCRRVADLCVAIGEDILGLSSCYTLEVAGLLHDIGKLSLPDSLLLKSEALTDDEWKVMRHHEKIGVELVKTAFDSDVLTEIVENFRIPYSRIIEDKLEVSQSAKILAIVDAFASMTADQTYRKAITSEEAIEELKRCAGHQFDPELIEKITVELGSKSHGLEQERERVSKAAALSIGLQIQSLSIALEKLDADGIEAIALRLVETAEKEGATQIAEKARLISELNAEVAEEGENYDLVMCTIELLDLCRASQAALIETTVL